jgi:hypothetical protein
VGRGNRPATGREMVPGDILLSKFLGVCLSRFVIVNHFDSWEYLFGFNLPDHVGAFFYRSSLKF